MLFKSFNIKTGKKKRGKNTGGGRLALKLRMASEQAEEDSQETNTGEQLRTWLMRQQDTLQKTREKKVNNRKRSLKQSCNKVAKTQGIKQREEREEHRENQKQMNTKPKSQQGLKGKTKAFSIFELDWN